jgi:hypothetical protein
MMKKYLMIFAMIFSLSFITLGDVSNHDPSLNTLPESTHPEMAIDMPEELNKKQKKIVALNVRELQMLHERHVASIKEFDIKDAELSESLYNVFHEQMLREKYRSHLINRQIELDKMLRDVKKNFGVTPLRTPLAQEMHRERMIDGYRAGNPNIVKVPNRSLPFELPDKNLPTDEYRRQYANRYAQAYNLSRRYDFDARIPMIHKDGHYGGMRGITGHKSTGVSD